MSMFRVGDLVQHRKGGLYKIINVPHENLRIEHFNEPYYMYRRSSDIRDTVWLRPKSQMEDGRFTKMGEIDVM